MRNGARLAASFRGVISDHHQRILRQESALCLPIWPGSWRGPQRAKYLLPEVPDLIASFNAFGVTAAADHAGLGAGPGSRDASIVSTTIVARISFFMCLSIKYRRGVVSPAQGGAPRGRAFWTSGGQIAGFSAPAHLRRAVWRQGCRAYAANQARSCCTPHRNRRIWRKARRRARAPWRRQRRKSEASP